MKTRILSVVFVAVIVLAGCATYGTRGAMPIMDRVQDKLVVVEKDGVEVRGFPILTKEISERYFDKDLPNDHILAIFLEVSNRTSSEVRLVSSKLKVGPTVVSPSTSDIAYKAVRREYAGKAFLWAFPTYFVGTPVSVIHTYFINDTIEKDIKEKELDFNKAIGPMGKTQGFIWFEIPKKVAPEYKDNGLPKGTTLNLSLEILEEKRLVEFIMPMP